MGCAAKILAGVLTIVLFVPILAVAGYACFQFYTNLGVQETKCIIRECDNHTVCDAKGCFNKIIFEPNITMHFQRVELITDKVCRVGGFHICWLLADGATISMQSPEKMQSMILVIVSCSLAVIYLFFVIVTLMYLC